MPNGRGHGYIEDPTIHLHFENGQIQTVKDSPQSTPKAMARTLVEANLIPGVDADGNPIDWRFYDKETNGTLDENRTWQENGIRNDHHLYLRRHVKPEITLHIHADGGRIFTVASLPQTDAGTVIQNLIREGKIPAVDERGGPIDWRLQDRSAGKKLDNAKSLAANGVAAGDHLYLERDDTNLTRIQFVVCKNCDAPNPVTSQFCVKCGAPLVEAKPIRLLIHAEAGTTHSVKVSPTATTDQLIERVVREFGLESEDSEGRAIEWLLDDNKTGQTMAPGKTLQDQGVLDGHHLTVHRQASPEPKPKPNLLLILSVAALLAIAVAAVVIIYRHLTTAPVSIKITTSPSGARIVVDGKEQGISPLNVTLPRGAHATIEASKDQYKTKDVAVDVRPGMQPVNVELEPLPRPDLWLSTNVPGATAQLDSDPLTQGSSMRFPPGDHVVSFVTSDNQTVSFDLHAAPDGFPAISSPAVPDSAIVTFVSYWNGQAQLHYVTPQNIQATVQLDDNPAVPLAADGMNFSVTPGASHSFTLTAGDQQWKLPLDAASEPALAVFIAVTGKAGPVPTTGTLVVVTTPPVDGAQVFVNNANRGSTRRGRLRLPGLAPGFYTVRIAKEGYDSSPTSTSTQVLAGGSRRLTFTAQPSRPLDASLRIENGIPGSDVSLDGKKVGSLDSAGTFTLDHVKAASQVVKVEHKDYAPWEVRQDFVAGQAARIRANQQELCEVVINTIPNPTKLTYRRAGDNQDYPIRPGVSLLAPGSYTFTAYWNERHCSQSADLTPRHHDVSATLTFRPNCQQ